MQAANGCASFYLAPVANDWTHGNSLQLTPDGNILYSSRHQDWIIKIDYRDGTGTGNILWRMGPGGDFTFNNVNHDPWPWFSHQRRKAESDETAVPIELERRPRSRNTFCTPLIVKPSR